MRTQFYGDQSRSHSTSHANPHYKAVPELIVVARLVEIHSTPCAGSLYKLSAVISVRVFCLSVNSFVLHALHKLLNNSV